MYNGGDFMWATIGWGVASMLLQWLLRKSADSDSSSSDQQPSKYTNSNANQIGSAVPVVLGRALVKNPLVSYYGDFDYKPYTEEYGMHSEADASGWWWPIILGILAAVIIPSMHPVASATNGVASDTDNGIKNSIIVYMVLNVLLAILSHLFNEHGGRTTIQKGFLYYLGWQHIICWTGDNIGIKCLYMNVYDPDVEESTFSGVWDNNSNIAWKKDNPKGIIAHIDDDQMFGGWDEGGGFIGDVRFYFGTEEQGKDPWMVDQMKSDLIPNDLKGLTPVYPMYFTCVVPKAYIGKQASIPEMWFEVHNYPHRLQDNCKYYMKVVYFKDIKERYQILLNYIASTPNSFQNYMLNPHTDMFNAFRDYENAVNDLKDKNDILSELKSDLDKRKKELEDELRDAQYALDQLIANRATAFATLNQQLTDLQAEKDRVLNQKRTNLANRTQYWDNAKDTAYASYQAALVGGNSQDIADTLANYNMIVSTSQQELDDLQAEIDAAEANYDIDIANKQQEITDFTPNYNLKIADAQQKIADIQQEIADLDNGINTAEQDAETASANVDAALSAFMAAVNASVAACHPYYVNDYTEAAQPLLDLFSKGQYTLNPLEQDLNPMEAIYEILKNEMWGCNYPDKRIDIDSMLRCAVTLEEENFGVSCLINQVAIAGDYIQKILAHINGICFDDPKTGKLTFKLIRADFKIEDLPRFTPSNCMSLKFTRLDWSSTSDRVTAKFIDADNKYKDCTMTVYDIANTKITHNIKEQQLDASYFTTPRNAQRYAKTALLSAAYPLAAINIECNRIGYDLTLGQPILVNWPPFGIDRQVFRVSDIDYGTLLDGKIQVTAVEDVFSFDITAYTEGDVIHWTDPILEPDAISHYAVFEVPYELQYSLDTYLRVYAARPSMEVIYYNLWRYLRGSYKRVSKTQTFSAVCKLTYTLPKSYDTSDSILIYAYGYGVQEQLEQKIEYIAEDPDSRNNRSTLNLLCIDNEIMSYDNIEKMPDGSYKLVGVRRGLYDTIPKRHAGDSTVYFLDNYTRVSTPNPVAREGSVSTEKLEICPETMDREKPFDIADVFEYTTVRRSERPSIMHNLYFGGDRSDYTTWKHFYDDTDVLSDSIRFKFNTRNKFNNISMLGQDDVGVNVEVASSTQNYIKIFCEGHTDEQKFDAHEMNGNTYITLNEFNITWADFCNLLGDDLKRINDVTVSIGTYDTIKDLYSFEEYVESFRWTIPQVIGIVPSDSDVANYFSSHAYQQRLIVEETSVNIPIAVDVSMGGLVLVGEIATANDGVLLGNGDVYYKNVTKAYICDSIDASDNITYREVDLQHGYVIRNNFSHLQYKEPEYFKYDGNGNWSAFTPADM